MELTELPWYTLRDILQWCSHPRDIAHVARTCRALYESIIEDKVHFRELALIYLKYGYIMYDKNNYSLWQAVRWGKPYYIELALAEGIDSDHEGRLKEAVYIAGSCGYAWVIHCIETKYPRLQWIKDFCMWRAAKGGHVSIVLEMIRKGATMITTAIEFAKQAHPNTPETEEIEWRLRAIFDHARNTGNIQLYC